MPTLTLANLRLPDGSPTAVGIADGRLVKADPGAEEENCEGLVVAPGLIDIQLNGGFGYDFTRDPSTIWEVGSRLPRYGVTAFVPTVISSDPATVVEARRVLAEGSPPGWEGAAPLGLHCEGPAISPQRHGAHPPGRLLPPGPDLVTAWGGTGGIRMVTLAPELEGAAALVGELREAGVVVAAGHSDADYETAVEGFRRGIEHVTHLFNAMSGLDHRAPGLAAAALATPAVTAGLICDGIHVHPGMVALAYRAKGAGGLALVTDAMAGMGMAEGSYRIGDVEVTVAGDRATTGEGVLAGSVLTMDRAVANFADFTGCSVAEAITAATATPAGIVGDRQRGSLAAGGRADLVLFDSELTVQRTVVGGRVLYRGDG